MSFIIVVFFVGGTSSLKEGGGFIVNKEMRCTTPSGGGRCGYVCVCPSSCNMRKLPPRKITWSIFIDVGLVQSGRHGPSQGVKVFSRPLEADHPHACLTFEAKKDDQWRALIKRERHTHRTHTAFCQGGTNFASWLPCELLSRSGKLPPFGRVNNWFIQLFLDLVSMFLASQTIHSKESKGESPK